MDSSPSSPPPITRIYRSSFIGQALVDTIEELLLIPKHSSSSSSPSSQEEEEEEKKQQHNHEDTLINMQQGEDIFTAFDTIMSCKTTWENENTMPKNTFKLKAAMKEYNQYLSVWRMTLTRVMLSSDNHTQDVKIVESDEMSLQLTQAL